jgi:lysophospholipase L1-like esterase
MAAQRPTACKVAADQARLDVPLARTARHLGSGQPIKIVALGSSSTYGMGASTRAATYPSRLTEELGRHFPGHKITILNRGVSGEEVADMLARLDTAVIAQKPDLVLWQVGTNDALAYVPLDEFETTVVDTLGWLKEHKVDVVLVGLQYVDQMALDDNYKAVRDLLRKIAAKENVMIVRRYEAQQFLARAESGGGGLVPDEFQRTEAGYVCLAQYMARAITLGIFGHKLKSMIPAPSAAAPQR